MANERKNEDQEQLTDENIVGKAAEDGGDNEEFDDADDMDDDDQDEGDVDAE